MNYYISRGGQTYGPYPEDAIRKYLSEGSMQATDLARTEGMVGFVPLKELLDKPSAAAAEPAGLPKMAPVPPSVFSSPPSPPAGGSASAKHQYLESIRAHSAYPTYRGFIGVITIFGYIVAGLIGLGSVVFGLVSMAKSVGAGLGVMVGGLIYAAIVFLLNRFFKEAALILADIGDSIVEANSRPRSGQ